MSLIASSIPGRLRLRDPALRDAARLENLRASFARWRGVTATEVNLRAGSLIIHYDPAQLAPARCESRAISATEKTFGLVAQLAPAKPISTQVNQKSPVTRPAPQPLPAPEAVKKPAVPRHSPSASRRVVVNRWAKRGMLVSLTVSLGLAAAGMKRWHWLSGLVFLHALGAHLWVHRRHILR